MNNLGPRDPNTAQQQHKIRLNPVEPYFMHKKATNWPLLAWCNHTKQIFVMFHFCYKRVIGIVSILDQTPPIPQ